MVLEGISVEFEQKKRCICYFQIVPKY